MKRIILEILFVWGCFIALILGLAVAARGQQPPTVIPSYTLVSLSVTNSVSATGLPPLVNISFQGWTTVNSNGALVTVSVGQPIATSFSTADTTSLSVTDINGTTQWVTRAEVANDLATISSQVLTAQLGAAKQ